MTLRFTGRYAINPRSVGGQHGAISCSLVESRALRLIRFFMHLKCYGA